MAASVLTMKLLGIAGLEIFATGRFHMNETFAGRARTTVCLRDSRLGLTLVVAAHGVVRSGRRGEYALGGRQFGKI